MRITQEACVSKRHSLLLMVGALLSRSKIGDIGDASLFGLFPLLVAVPLPDRCAAELQMGRAPSCAPWAIFPDPSPLSDRTPLTPGDLKLWCAAPRLVKRDPCLPSSVLHENSCDRDYGVLCPDGFLNIGNVKGGGKDYCFASPRFAPHWPCQQEDTRLMSPRIFLAVTTGRAPAMRQSLSTLRAPWA